MDIAWHGKGLRPERNRENTGGYNTGFYGTDALPWYIGITFHNDGIDNARCEDMFQKGFALNMKMAEYRRDIIGMSGGAVTGCVGYSLGAYPIADFNFIRSHRGSHRRRPLSKAQLRIQIFGLYRLESLTKQSRVWLWRQLSLRLLAPRKRHQLSPKRDSLSLWKFYQYTTPVRLIQ